MANWIVIILAAAFAFNGLMQLRMTLVYMGVFSSSVVGQVSSTESLIHTSLRSAVPSLVCSVILFIIQWPMIITYVVGVFAIREIIDLFLVLFCVGNYRVAKDSTELRLHHFKVQIMVVATYLIVILISSYYLGY